MIKYALDMANEAWKHNTFKFHQDVDGITEYKEVEKFIEDCITKSAEKGYQHCYPNAFMPYNIRNQIIIELIRKGYNVCIGLAGEVYYISWDTAEKYCHVNPVIIKLAKEEM